MKPFLTRLVPLSLIALCAVSCSQLSRPSGWPVAVSPTASAVAHMKEHVKFSGTSESLTHAEKSLLTFLDSPDNIAASAGKKNRPGSHQWSAAKIYQVDPGKHLSVLCENGYQQKAVYFHYNEAEKTWYRVPHLDQKHGKGVRAVKVK
ncbi:MAG: hypothetical protein ACPG32_04600 [Akkermansiaceae bacterium]